jgi:cytochrome c oxidase subunit 4
MAHTPLQKAAARHQEVNHHVVSTGTSVMVLIALAVLMGITIGASYIDMGSVVRNNIFAMLIACTKAFLVMWFFMGLKWSTGLTRLWAVAGFAVFILMFIILFDYGMRSNEEVAGWDTQMETAMPRTVNPTKVHENQPDKFNAGFLPRNP